MFQQEPQIRRGESFGRDLEAHQPQGNSMELGQVVVSWLGDGIGRHAVRRGQVKLHRARQELAVGPQDLDG